MKEEVATQILNEIKRYMLLAAKTVLSVEDVVLLTGLSSDTIYRWSHNHTIPCYKPNGGKIFFEKSDVEAWMRKNRIASKDEVDAKAIAHDIQQREKKIRGTKKVAAV